MENVIPSRERGSWSIDNLRCQSSNDFFLVTRCTKNRWASWTQRKGTGHQHKSRWAMCYHGTRASKGSIKDLVATEDRMTDYECRGWWSQNIFSDSRERDSAASEARVITSWTSPNEEFKKRKTLISSWDVRCTRRPPNNGTVREEAETPRIKRDERPKSPATGRHTPGPHRR